MNESVLYVEKKKGSLKTALMILGLIFAFLFFILPILATNFSSETGELFEKIFHIIGYSCLVVGGGSLVLGIVYFAFKRRGNAIYYIGLGVLLILLGVWLIPGTISILGFNIDWGPKALPGYR